MSFHALTCWKEFKSVIIHLWLAVLHVLHFNFNSHENSSGYYRVSSYFLSKVLVDLIPLRVIPIPLFSVTAYWMIGMFISYHCMYSFSSCAHTYIQTYVHAYVYIYTRIKKE